MGTFIITFGIIALAAYIFFANLEIYAEVLLLFFSRSSGIS